MKRSCRGLAVCGLLLGLLMLLGGTASAVAETPRAAAPAKLRRPRPPLHPPEHIVLGSRPVAIRLPIPRAILEEIRTTAPGAEEKTYRIHFHGLEVPAHRATRIRGYARRWVSLATLGREDERYVGVVGTLARTVPQRFDDLMRIQRDQLRRFIGQRDYLVLTLVQVDSSGYFLARGVTVPIERIHLTTAMLGEEVEAPSANPPAAP